MTVEILRVPVSRARIASLVEAQFGDMVKAVVDVERRVMAVGGELHADEEAALIEDGSTQRDLWGINLYPREQGDAWIEFDSMTNAVRHRGIDRASSMMSDFEMPFVASSGEPVEP